MKFTLTITDASATDLSRLLATLGGAVAVTAGMDTAAIPAMPTNTGNDDGDEAGPVNTNAPAVDSAGLPWDERIHSSNKQTTDKGVWRKRRGVSDAIVAQVENELRTNIAATIPAQPTNVVTQPVPMPAPAPQPMQMPQPNGYPTGPGYPPQPTNVVTQPVPMPMPTAAPQPMQTVVAPAPVGGVAMDFPTFMQALSGQMQKRDANGMPLIDTDYLARTTAEVSTAFGTPLGVITDIVSQPRAAEMIVYAVQILTRDGKWN